MASLADEDGRPLPFGWIGTTVFCVVLTLLFLIWGFPYELVSQRLLGALRGATGAEVRVATLGPYLSWAGPGIEATEVRITGSDGTRFDFERLRARPAWSLAWLRLDPAVFLDAQGELGQVSGVAVLDGEQPAFDGKIQGMNLARLPVDALWPQITLSGTLDADIDVTSGEPAPVGSVHFEARDGGLGATGLPMGLPFETITGELALGGESLVQIVSFHAESPMFTAEASGQIGKADYFVQAPLDLRIQVQAQPRFVPALQRLGLQVSPGGAATVRITGTPSEPQVN